MAGLADKAGCATPVAELWVRIQPGWGACWGESMVGIRYETPNGTHDVLTAVPVEGVELIAKPLGSSMNSQAGVGNTQRRGE